ncbi:MAG: hypothetical protein ACHP7P_13615, partial [Terriglobales bacterium]
MSLNVLPIPIGAGSGPGLWLPGDKGDFTPLGDPMPFVSTQASPAIFTIQSYTPTAGDRISLTPGATGALPSGATAGTIYYVIATGLNATTGAFELSATATGAGINGAAAGAGNAHVFRAQSGLNVIPVNFKPGRTVLVYNGSTGSLVLYGAPDTGAQAGAPQGYNSGAVVTLATVAAYA